MYKGQKLCLIAACLLFIATFAFYWFSYIFADVVYYTNGFGLIRNYLDLWTNYNTKSLELGLPYVFYYGIIVLFTILICSPIFLIIGMKIRASSIIGSIMPIIVGVFIILYAFIGFGLTFINWLSLLGDSEPMIEGIFPISLGIEGRFEFFGAYVLLAGGIIGLIGGKVGPKEV
ncbi:MAG: hypothetical protein ACFFAH_03850 [Promethearchaeota archaeon]